MSDEFAGRLASIGESLSATAGGYLRNTIRKPGVTCRVCASPVTEYPTCWACSRHLDSGETLADRVATMVYATEGGRSTYADQTYVAMYGYKGANPQLPHVQLVRSLVALGIGGHLICAHRMSGLPTLRWSSVPGTGHQRSEHPLHQIVAPMFSSPEFEVPLTMCTGATKGRALQPENFRVEGPVDGSTHVVLIDDSWVTGGSAQSAAIAVRRAGAGSVSILALARVLNPGFGPTSAFLRSSWARQDFDYRICPWTNGQCPTAHAPD